MDQGRNQASASPDPLRKETHVRSDARGHRVHLKQILVTDAYPEVDEDSILLTHLTH